MIKTDCVTGNGLIDTKLDRNVTCFLKLDCYKNITELNFSHAYTYKIEIKDLNMK